jgi:hypothetical protein
MLYTFAHAADSSQVNADLAELRAALPAGAITSYISPLPTERGIGYAQALDAPAVVRSRSSPCWSQC